MEILKVSIKEIHPNEDNPRMISDSKFRKLVKSIKEFPDMLKIRPIVVDADNIVLGGNMRLKACKEAGLKEVHIIKADSLTDDQKKEFIVKDNVGFGEWDWEIIENDWDLKVLEKWGLDLPDYLSEMNIDEDDLDEAFSLADGDKEPFQQMTFTLADEQVEEIKEKLAEAKQSENFKMIDTFGNENGNGNALYAVVMGLL